MNTVLRRKSAMRAPRVELRVEAHGVPFISTQWQATNSPCTWKSGSMWTRMSSGRNPQYACSTLALEARLRCVIIAPLERPVVPGGIEDRREVVGAPRDRVERDRRRRGPLREAALAVLVQREDVADAELRRERLEPRQGPGLRDDRAAARAFSRK